MNCSPVLLVAEADTIHLGERDGTIYFLLKEKRNNLVGFLLYNVLETISKKSVKELSCKIDDWNFKKER